MKNSIYKKFIVRLILSTVVVSIGIFAVVAINFNKNVVGKYEYVGEALTTTLAGDIDGDKIEEYLRTGKPDEYYDSVLQNIDDCTKNFKALYVYVAIPTEDNVLYIWSNGFTGEETIGYTTDYSQGGKEWMQDKFKGKKVKTLCYVSDKEFGYIATAATPIRNSKGEIVALALADFSLKEIRVAVAKIIWAVLSYVIVLMLVYTLVFYHYFNRHIVTPMNKLINVSKNLTDRLDKDTMYVSDIHTGDELEVLSKAFEKMNKELREYIKDNISITAEKERIGAELNMAASIQENQLPNVFPAFPDRKEFDIYAFMKPAKTVGGDFYDFFMVDDTHMALVMADVSGKGIPASLFMMISKILIKNHVQAGEDPGQALGNVNRQLLENNKERQFVTVWLAIVDLTTGKGIATNAGHEHPVICRKGGEYELVEYKHSPPVATLKKTIFKNHEFELHPGDKLFVYTDGVPEATNKNDKLYDTDRMLSALNKENDANPKKTIEIVMNSIYAFINGAEQFDDITMLCFEYFGIPTNEEEDK